MPEIEDVIPRKIEEKILEVDKEIKTTEKKLEEKIQEVEVGCRIEESGFMLVFFTICHFCFIFVCYCFISVFLLHVYFFSYIFFYNVR